MDSVPFIHSPYLTIQQREKPCGFMILENTPGIVSLKIIKHNKEKYKEVFNWIRLQKL
jgi:hypothetical protein